MYGLPWFPNHEDGKAQLHHYTACWCCVQLRIALVFDRFCQMGKMWSEMQRIVCFWCRIRRYLNKTSPTVKLDVGAMVHVYSKFLLSFHWGIVRIITRKHLFTVIWWVKMLIELIKSPMPNFLKWKDSNLNLDSESESDFSDDHNSGPTMSLEKMRPQPRSQHWGFLIRPIFFVIQDFAG